MKRLCGLIVLATFVIGGAFANGNSESSSSKASSKQTRFVFVVKDMTNPYYWRMRDGATKAAEQYKVELSWLAARENGDIQGEVNIVETQLTLHPDALILVPMNATALVPQIRNANKMKIPVFIPDTRIQEGSAEYVSFIGLDEQASAEMMADFLVKHFNGQAKLAILEGFRGSSTAELRLKGFQAVFDKNPGMQVVASVAADWDREKGLSATEDILQAHPDVQCILASNDEMALGAIQAVKTAGLSDKVVVTGDDAIPEALQALKDGSLLATIDGNTDQVGFKAVEAAYNYVVKKESQPKWVKVPSSLLTAKDITSAYLESRGIKLK
jgi:ribose transport system substrate-binding protein